MKHLKIYLLTALLFLIGGLRASADYLTSTEYTNALNTIVTGKSYTIYTVVNGTRWYVKLDGELTSNAAQRGVFNVIAGSAGDYEKGFHFTFDNNGTTKRVGVDGEFHSAAGHPFADGTFRQKPLEFGNHTSESAFQTKVLFLKGDGDQKGNYAIRAGNTASEGVGTWGGDCSDTFWDIAEVDGVAHMGSIKNVAKYIWRFATTDGTPLVTSPLQLANDKVYTVRTSRGYMTLSNDLSEVVSSNASANPSANADTKYRKWGIVNKDGLYYFYNKEVKKFWHASYSGWKTGGGYYVKTKLVSDRGTALEVLKDGDGNNEGSRIRFSPPGLGNAYVNIDNTNFKTGLLCWANSNDPDANGFTVEEVDGETLDIAEALDIFNGPATMFDETKVYHITAARTAGYPLTVNADGTALVGSGTGDYGNPTAKTEEKLFTISKRNGNYRLRNLRTGMYLSTSGSFTNIAGDIASVDFFDTDEAEYPYQFYIVQTGSCFNTQTNQNVEVLGSTSQWYQTHAANQYKIAAVGDYQSYLPFTVSADYEHAHWYNLKRGIKYRYMGWEDREPYHLHDAVYPTEPSQYNDSEFDATPIVRASDAFQWAFIGNLHDGYQIINKHKGADYGLTVGEESPGASGGTSANTVLRTSSDRWNLHFSNNGYYADALNSFSFSKLGTNYYMNVNGAGGDGWLQSWNSTGARNDGNSCTWIEAVPDAEVTLKAGGDDYCYATFCLPYEVTVTGATAYTIAGDEDLTDGYAHLTALEGGVIPAGTPVVLRGEGSVATLSYNCGNYSLAPLASTKLTGTFKPTTIAAADYVLSKGNNNIGFYHWSQNTLPANKAYLTSINAASIKGFAFDFSDDATGIASPLGETGEGAAIYNLAGQRLGKMQKGINIVNGKKVLF